MPNLPKPKVILVTSQVTYVPNNYLGLFESLLAQEPGLIAGVIFLKNLDLQLLKSILGLRFLGAKRLQKTVLKNLSSLRSDPRKVLLNQHKIPYATFGNMNEGSAIAWCQERSPHLIVNARTRCIYKNDILNVPQWGCLNIHHGLLPQYRGTMCDLYALADSRPAGFTIHQMNPKIDDGKIFVSCPVSDKGPTNYPAYLEKASRTEGLELSLFLKQCAEIKRLPDGLENQSDDVVFTKNPTRKRVKELLAAGMVL